jgi:hypothetical protein
LITVIKVRVLPSGSRSKADRFLWPVGARAVAFLFFRIWSRPSKLPEVEEADMALHDKVPV